MSKEDKLVVYVAECDGGGCYHYKPTESEINCLAREINGRVLKEEDFSRRDIEDRFERAFYSKYKEFFDLGFIAMLSVKKVDFSEIWIKFSNGYKDCFAILGDEVEAWAIVFYLKEKFNCVI